MTAIYPDWGVYYLNGHEDIAMFVKEAVLKVLTVLSRDFNLLDISEKNFFFIRINVKDLRIKLLVRTAFIIKAHTIIIKVREEALVLLVHTQIIGIDSAVILMVIV